MNAARPVPLGTLFSPTVRRIYLKTLSRQPSRAGFDRYLYVVQDHTLFRPTMLRNSRGQAKKARRKLGWEASMRIRDIVREIIRHELQA